MATCNINSLLDSGKCWSCLTAGEMDIVELQLLCEILAAGGGGGVGQSQTPWLSDINSNGFNLSSNGAGLIIEGAITFPADPSVDPVVFQFGDGGWSEHCSGPVFFDGASIELHSDGTLQLRGDGGVSISTDGIIYYLIPKQQSGKSAVVAATSIAVVFAKAMPDANYSVALSGSAALVSPFISAIANTGFTVSLTAFTGTMYWTATQNTQ